MEKSNADSNDGLMDVDPPIQSVIGPDGLRVFILLPLWTINDFNSKIKETHFKTLRDKFQVPDNIPMHLPYKTEKCYYEGVKDISLNAWRVSLSVEVLYDTMSDRARRLTVEEFFNCYRPAKITQSKAMYNFALRSPLLRFICENPDSNRDWKSRCFFFEGDGWMCHPGDTEFMSIDKT